MIRLHSLTFFQSLELSAPAHHGPFKQSAAELRDYSDANQNCCGERDVTQRQRLISTFTPRNHAAIH